MWSKCLHVTFWHGRVFVLFYGLLFFCSLLQTAKHVESGFSLHLNSRKMTGTVGLPQLHPWIPSVSKGAQSWEAKMISAPFLFLRIRMRTSLLMILNHPAKSPRSLMSVALKGICFCFVSSCVNSHYSLALGSCWLADCNQNQWAFDGEPELHSAVGFAHLMSKYTEALYLKPDGNAVPCSGSSQTKSHLCSDARSQFSQQFLYIAPSELGHKQISWCRIWSWHPIPLVIKILLNQQ